MKDSWEYLDNSSAEEIEAYLAPKPRVRSSFSLPKINIPRVSLGLSCDEIALISIIVAQIAISIYEKGDY